MKQFVLTVNRTFQSMTKKVFSIFNFLDWIWFIIKINFVVSSKEENCECHLAISSKFSTLFSASFVVELPKYTKITRTVRRKIPTQKFTDKRKLFKLSFFSKPRTIAKDAKIIWNYKNKKKNQFYQQFSTIFTISYQSIHENQNWMEREYFVENIQSVTKSKKNIKK